MPVAAIILISLGGFLAVMNGACLLSSYVTKKHSSMVPPLGGVLLAFGFAMIDALRPYAVYALMLDVGFWAMLIGFPFMLLELLKSAPWRGP